MNKLPETTALLHSEKKSEQAKVAFTEYYYPDKCNYL